MKVDSHTLKYIVDTSLQIDNDSDLSKLLDPKELPWKHNEDNDDDIDNDLISNIAFVRNNILHEIIDFYFPELTDFELHLFDDNSSIWKRIQNFNENDVDSEIDKWVPPMYDLVKEHIDIQTGIKPAKQRKYYNTIFGRDKISTINNYANYSKYISDTLRRLQRKQFEDGGSKIVCYDNHVWEANINTEVERTNLKMYAGTDEHLCESIANHIRGRGLEGEFTITPWMEDYINKCISEGQLGWDIIIPCTSEVLDRGKKRAEYIWDATIQNNIKLSSSQALYSVVGNMWTEDGWYDKTPKLHNRQEEGGHSSNSATAGLVNCGEGWFQLTGWNAKVKCAQTAGVDIPSQSGYNVNTCLSTKSDEAWAKLTIAFIYMQGKMVTDLMLDKEPESDVDLEEIACLGYAYKAGMGFDSKRHNHDGESPIKRKFMCADETYADFNGNGKHGASSFISAWILGQYCSDKNNKTPDELKNEIGKKFNIPAAVTKRHRSKSSSR